MAINEMARNEIENMAYLAAWRKWRNGNEKRQ
jgi:hypothetical protein